MKLVIEEKNWLRAGGPGSGYLLDKDGKMCCLGFYAKQCGYTDKDILYKGGPASINDGEKSEFSSNNPIRRLLRSNDNVIFETNNGICWSLMHTNDDCTITDEVRKQNITEIFKEIGVEVEFV